MAEIFILIVFVLLLALTFLLRQERERRQEDRQALAEIAATVSEDAELSAKGVSTEGVLQEPNDTPSAIVSQVQQLKEESDNWRELVSETEARHGQGVAPGSQTLMDIVRDAERWREYRDSTENDMASPLEQAEEQIVTLNEQIERLENQVQGGGGTDHPSCWYDDDGSVAYLFDVGLMETGLILRLHESPQHEDERRELPLSPIQFGRVLSSTQFVEQTRPIYDRSVAQECRFFALAFDHTSPAQKELYKTRMQQLEQHFYKFAYPTGPSPFAPR